MNFEAVPCMFKQTVDGNESSYVGLLIRPSTQTPSGSNPPTNTTAVATPTNVQTTSYNTPIASSQTEQNPQNGQTAMLSTAQSSATSPTGNFASAPGRRPIQAATPLSNGYVNTNNAFYPQKQLQPRPTTANHHHHQQQQQLEPQTPYLQNQMQQPQQQACTSVQPAANCSTAGGWSRTPQSSQSVQQQQQHLLNQQQIQHQQQLVQHQQQNPWNNAEYDGAGCSSWGNSYSNTRTQQQWQHSGIAGSSTQLPTPQQSPIAPHPPYPQSQWNAQQAASSQQIASAKRRNSRNHQMHSTPQMPPQISPTTDSFSPSHHSQVNNGGGLPPISSITRQSPLECSSTAGPSMTPILGHYNQNSTPTNGYSGYPQSTPSQSSGNNYYSQPQSQPQQAYHQSQMYHQQQQQQQRQQQPQPQRIQQPPQYPQMAQQHYPAQMTSNAEFARYPASSQHQWISPVPANSSATPDSGIQSIGDSPHSANPYTPPIVSPYAQQMASVEEREKALPPPSLDSNEFADMPKLVPMNQMEEIAEEDDFESGPPNIAGIPDCGETTTILDMNSAVSSPDGMKCPSLGPAVEIHAGMDTKEVTQQLVLTFGEQRIKEMAELLQSQTTCASSLGFVPESITPAPDSTTNGESEDIGQFVSPAPSFDDICSPYPLLETVIPPPMTVIDETMLKEREKTEARMRLAEHRKNVRENVRRTFDRYLGDIEDDLSSISLGESESREDCIFVSLDWASVNDRVNQKRAQREKEANRKRKSSQSVEKSEKKSKTARKRKIEGKFERAPFTVQSTSGKKSSSERANSKKSRPSFSERPQGHDYQKIRSNATVDAPSRVDDTEPCECDARSFCSPNAQCFHRERRVECTPSNCTLHNVCENRRIYSNQTITDLVKSAKSDGSMCLRTGVDIHRGEYVCEYVGEVISKTRFESRFSSEYSTWRHHYAMELCAGFIVDAYKRGNISRFVNHSCDANCVAQTWLVNGFPRLCIFADREILAGEELTIDYSGVHCSFLNPPQKCCCDSTDCRGFITPVSEESKVAAATTPSADSLSSDQRKLVRSKRVFLLRNLKAKRRRKSDFYKNHTKEKLILRRMLQEVIDFALKNDYLPKRRIPQIRYRILQVLKQSRKSCTISELVESFDDVFRTQIDLATRIVDRRRAESLRAHYASLKKSSELFRHAARNAKDTKEAKILPARTDLSYMNSSHPVGSYNPDESTLELAESAKPDEQDVVRCVCGILDEDGTMVQCDSCHFWLHSDCLEQKPKENEDFSCKFCAENLKMTPSVNILLHPPPEIRFESCTYYRTLVNSREIQVRINETVYVERLTDDKHKATLKKLNEFVGKPPSKASKRELAKKSSARASSSASSAKPKTLFERRDLRIFRVERLFRGPNNEPFVFGCYYARPHETFCDSHRLFFKNELFWTPFFDTLPLEAVVGRCLVLEPSIYVEGRPKLPKYREEDVFICEYQIDKMQRSFEKINAKSRYYINTQPYVFDRFDTPIQSKRDFTPFLVASHRSAEKLEAKEKRETNARKLGADHLAEIANRLSKSLVSQRTP